MNVSLLLSARGSRQYGRMLSQRPARQDSKVLATVGLGKYRHWVLFRTFTGNNHQQIIRMLPGPGKRATSIQLYQWLLQATGKTELTMIARYAGNSEAVRLGRRNRAADSLHIVGRGRRSKNPDIHQPGHKDRQ